MPEERIAALAREGIEEAIGRVRGRRDAVWRSHRVAVELDGWEAHRTRRAFQRDRVKGNAIQTAGYALLRFTHDDVMRRPSEVAADVAKQLSRAA